MNARPLYRRAARSQQGTTLIVTAYGPDDVRLSVYAAGMKTSLQLMSGEALGLAQLITLAGEAAAPPKPEPIPTPEAADSDFATYESVATDSQKRAPL